MKKYPLFILLFWSFVTVNAQNRYVYRLYNITAENSAGKILINAQNIPVQVALIFNSKNAGPSYVETQKINTKTNGKFSLTIGKGDYVSGLPWDKLPQNSNKVFAKVWVEGNYVGIFEAQKQKDYSNLDNKSVRVVKPPINQSKGSISDNNRIMKKITVGGTELSAGDGIVFIGKNNRFTVSSPHQRITFKTDSNIEISGTYPHYAISLKKHKVGEEYLGGKIIKVSDDGQHGTVAKVIDGVNNFDGNLYTWTTFETNDRAKKITSKYSAFKTLNLWGGGSGKINTLIMLVNDNRYAYLDTGETYSVTEIIKLGYDDWYLPSYEELLDFYTLNKSTGLFNKELNLSEGHIFWTSTEDLKSDNKIWKGHKDGPDGRALTGEDYPGKYVIENDIVIPSRSNSKNPFSEGGFKGITGVYALNFYSGKFVTVAKYHWERVVLFKDF